MLAIIDYVEVIVRKRRYSRKLIKVMKPIYKNMGKVVAKDIDRMNLVYGFGNSKASLEERIGE